MVQRSRAAGNPCARRDLASTGADASLLSWLGVTSQYRKNSRAIHDALTLTHVLAVLQDALTQCRGVERRLQLDLNTGSTLTGKRVRVQLVAHAKPGEALHR